MFLTDMMKGWWTNHGTKILGFGTALITAVSYIDEKTVNIIQTTLGDAWAHGILIVSGLATAYRGFVNSQVNKANGPN
jgi:hypothetical protein